MEADRPRPHIQALTSQSSHALMKRGQPCWIEFRQRGVLLPETGIVVPRQEGDVHGSPHHGSGDLKRHPPLPLDFRWTERDLNLVAESAGEIEHPLQ